jgi:3-phenylpropionate/trans-cinnamate dioxygenase ferredoxin reductase subunit
MRVPAAHSEGATMNAFRYVIIGGGLAGQRAADAIRKVDPDGGIALVAEEAHLPYQRPPLSKGYLTGKEGLDHVYLQDAAYYAERGIEVMTATQAVRVSPAERTVALANGQTLGFNKLLLATGASARKLPIPGSELGGVFTLRTIGDADAIRAAAQQGKRALVVGGSFIGSEVAASLAKLGLDVTMVFPEQRLLERIAPPELSQFLQDMYRSHGVRLMPTTRPVSLLGDGAVQRVALDDGRMVDVDMVVLGVGVRLNTQLAADAGLALNKQGAVVVDEQLCSSHPAIYAAGDIAEWPDATFGKRLRLEHWDVARAQGLRAGRNMAGEAKAYSALPYFYSDVFDISFEVWGDLSAWDKTVLRGNIEGGSFALYYFDQGRMTGVLAAGRPESERKPMQALVAARPRLGDVSARVVDEDIDLNDLVV